MLELSATLCVPLGKGDRAQRREGVCWGGSSPPLDLPLMRCARGRKNFSQTFLPRSGETPLPLLSNRQRLEEFANFTLAIGE